MANSLADFDPAEAWQPARHEAWDLKSAAHLYRRAAFGFPASDGASTAWELLERAVARGREACIDELLAGGQGQASFDALTDALGEQIAALNVPRFQPLQPEKLQGWWLYRMVHTPHPLRERCTLFWHNHFATSIAKVGRSELMFRQNQLLRRHALGKFGPLLAGISHDPAMLIWLDSNSNIKGRPNENYAREILELFSLGVGNYSEEDIRQAARAFTGWGTAGGEFVFNENLHDGGDKTVLGQSGRLGGDDVVRIILAQPACARFLAGKLFREFVSQNEPPPAALIEPLAAQLRDSDYDIQGCLATILRSRIFFSQQAYRARIKSPVDYVVGLARAFDAKVSLENLAKAMDGLGQTLFAPPNVKGWDGGQAWLNSATLLARHNLAAQLVGGEGELAGAFRIESLAAVAGEDVEKQTRFLLELLLQDDVGPQARAALVAFAARQEPPPPSPQRRLRELAHTILLMPEFQLA